MVEGYYSSAVVILNNHLLVLKHFCCMTHGMFKSCIPIPLQTRRVDKNRTAVYFLKMVNLTASSFGRGLEDEKHWLKGGGS